MKEIVMPGELLENEALRIDNTYVENGKTYAKILGLYEKDKKTIVPLEGIWNPRVGDEIVGIITSLKNVVYDVDLAYFGKSILIGSKYDRHVHKAGDVIQAVVKDIENRKTIILSGERVLYGGTILTIKPTKVPRVIGKSNTMIQQICDLTKSNIIVGKNGIVWIKGGNISLATTAIRQIENEAHVSGLTERIKKMLEEKSVA